MAVPSYADEANEYIAMEIVDGRPPAVTGFFRTVTSVGEF